MKKMNNEKMNQMIGEAYKEYVSTHENFEWTDDFCKKNLKDCGDQWDVFSQEEFINKCKTDTEFSQKWGLRIEERALSLEERYKIWFKNNFETGMEYNENNLTDFENDYYESTPTRLIKLTYDNETIEVYE